MKTHIMEIVYFPGEDRTVFSFLITSEMHYLINSPNRSSLNDIDEIASLLLSSLSFG